MRYRAGMIGGSLAIQQPAGGGTAVVCTAHLPGQVRPKRRPKTVRKRTLKKE
jgi:hypothetical protein